MKEIWKPVKGREDFYEVSNTGKVRSLVGRYKSKEIFELKQYVNKKGYCSLDLAMPELKKYSVHRLVAETFCDKPEGHNVVNHIDNNPSNNIYTNLEWTTYSGNLKHAQNQGRLFNAQSKGGKVTGKRASEALFTATTEMVGKEYGSLTVISEGSVVKYKNANRPRLVCKCTCGTESEYCKIQLEKSKVTKCKTCASKQLGYERRKKRIQELANTAAGNLVFTGISTNSNKLDMKDVKVQLYNITTNEYEWHSYRKATSSRFLNKHKDIV